MPTIAALEKWYRAHEEEILRDFMAFLRFPSISTDPTYAPEVRKTARWLSAYMNAFGLKTTIWESSGLPAVFGEDLRAGPDKPTVLIYHHYDVQPVDPLELWESPPFDPVIRDQKVYARGAVDNKGQCFYTLTALKALYQLMGTLPVNVKVFIEGEEESGGPGTLEIIRQKKEALRADHLLIVDLDIPAPGMPAITVGMRGLVALNIECSNSSGDLHSGVHGGIALNPNRALVQMLAKLWDPSGRVAVPGFYDRVKPFPKEHRDHLDLSFDEAAYKKEFGVRAFAGEEGCSLRESNWLRPTLEINGMSGGYTGTGFKTVIPAKASAKISCRLVPDQDPEEIAKQIETYLREVAPQGIEVHVSVHHGAPAFQGKLDSSIVKTAALAYEEVLGKPCKYLLCGASVPIVVDLAEASGAEVALIGMGLATDAIHAPNEHFGLDRFEMGYLTIGRIIGGR
ncbi:MAG: dipeptidase [Verrucomicrobia bacterium]|nr:dipeptidase [Verrucomicrobiota bacterium]